MGHRLLNFGLMLAVWGVFAWWASGLMQSAQETLRVMNLHEAAIEGNVQHLKLRWRERKDVQGWDGGRTLLMSAAAQGRPAMAAYLLKNGADIDAVDGAGRTALMQAADVSREMFGPDHVRTAKLLLQAGARREVKDHSGRTAAEIAKQRGYQGLARILAAGQ